MNSTQKNSTKSSADDDWSARLLAAGNAGLPPKHEDLIAGLNALLKENSLLKDFSKEASALIGEMVVARHLNDTPRLLNAIDQFIEKRVVITGTGSNVTRH